MLKTLKIKPSLVILFDCSEDTSITRLSNRKIDPQTGVYYDLSLAPPSDETIIKRLLPIDEDQEDIVRKRFGKWIEFQPKLEEAFKGTILQVNAEKTKDEIAQSIADSIQNPISS
jgi:adenylate kinase